jgi:hypothetical protein
MKDVMNVEDTDSLEKRKFHYGSVNLEVDGAVSF